MGAYVSTYVCEASAVQAKAGAGSPFLLLDSVQSLLPGFDAQLRCVLKMLFSVKRGTKIVREGKPGF